MSILRADMHSLLNAYIIKLLNKNKIINTIDFLREDANKLMQITNIDLFEIELIKRHFWENTGITPINGLTHYNQLMCCASYQPTDIAGFDELLNGGLLPGNIIDFCGLSAAGKTQLCTTIAINLAQNHHLETFWIDTKADFSGHRIYRILENRQRTETEIRQIMERIKLEVCNEPKKLIKIVTKLIEQIDKYRNFKMLIIDSMPSLWFLFYGEKCSTGIQQLAILGNLLRKLAVEHNVIVVNVNIVTRWTLCELGDETIVEDLGDNIGSLPANYAPTLAPALGKYWQSICSNRFLITKTYNGNGDLSQTNVVNTSNRSNNISKRFIQIIKSNQLKTDKQCTINITDTGVI